MRARNASKVGQVALRSYSIVLILVIRSDGSCGSSSPVRRSSVPFCTLNAHGLASSAATGIWISLSLRASESIAWIDFADSERKAWADPAFFASGSSRRAISDQMLCALAFAARSAPPRSAIQR